jgi:hypothetical protein
VLAQMLEAVAGEAAKRQLLCRHSLYAIPARYGLQW